MKLTIDLKPDLRLADDVIASRLEFSGGKLTLWGYGPPALFDREAEKWNDSRGGEPHLPHLVASLDVSGAKMLRLALEAYIDQKGKAKARTAPPEEGDDAGEGS